MQRYFALFCRIYDLQFTYHLTLIIKVYYDISEPIGDRNKPGLDSNDFKNSTIPLNHI